MIPKTWLNVHDGQILEGHCPFCPPPLLSFPCLTLATILLFLWLNTDSEVLTKPPFSSRGWIQDFGKGSEQRGGSLKQGVWGAAPRSYRVFPFIAPKSCQNKT